MWNEYGTTPSGWIRQLPVPFGYWMKVKSD